ncbi:hypothetical protein MMC26_004082 [Xylographa opegraphella]|nr:hypothetical protein [Xylographa opegraphella]
MASGFTGSDEGKESGYDGDVKMASGDAYEVTNQYTLGSINDDTGGPHHGEEVGGEGPGKKDGEQGEMSTEGDSDSDFPSQFGEGVPLEDDGAFEAEEEMFRDSEEIGWYATEPGSEEEECDRGGPGSESEGDR